MLMRALYRDPVISAYKRQFGNKMIERSEVTIVDIKMPFGSMVAFMVTAVLAAIPAMIIVALIFFGFAAILALFTGINLNV